MTFTLTHKLFLVERLGSRMAHPPTAPMRAKLTHSLLFASHLNIDAYVSPFGPIQREPCNLP